MEARKAAGDQLGALTAVWQRQEEGRIRIILDLPSLFQPHYGHWTFMDHKSSQDGTIAGLEAVDRRFWKYGSSSGNGEAPHHWVGSSSDVFPENSWLANTLKVLSMSFWLVKGVTEEKPLSNFYFKIRYVYLLPRSLSCTAKVILDGIKYSGRIRLVWSRLREGYNYSKYPLDFC